MWADVKGVGRCDMGRGSRLSEKRRRRGESGFNSNDLVEARHVENGFDRRVKRADRIGVLMRRHELGDDQQHAKAETADVIDVRHIYDERFGAAVDFLARMGFQRLGRRSVETTLRADNQNRISIRAIYGVIGYFKTHVGAVLTWKER